MHSKGPTKGFMRLSGQEAENLKTLIHAMLIKATEVGAEQLKISGVTFVTNAIAILAEELAELDPTQAAKFLNSLTVLHDPKARHGQKVAAERKRRAAVEYLVEVADAAIEADKQTKQ